MHTWRILKYNTFKIQFKIIFSFLKISISKKILIDILFSVSTTHADNYYLLLNALIKRFKRKYVVAYSCIFDVPQWLVFPYSLCLIFIISQKTHFTWSKNHIPYIWRTLLFISIYWLNLILSGIFPVYIWKQCESNDMWNCTIVICIE